MSQRRHHTMIGFARRLLLVTLTAAVTTGAAAQIPSPSVRLDGVRIVERADGTAIHLRTGGRVRYQSELIDGPTRLLVDLDDTLFAWRGGPIDVSRAPLRQVRGSQWKKGVTRVVLEFTRPVTYTIVEDGEGLVVVVPAERADASRSARASVVRDAPSIAPALAMQAAEREPAAPASTNISSPRTPDTPSIVVVQATRPAAPAPAPPTAPAAAPSGSRLISLDFKDADIVNLLRILAAESGKNIVISDDVKGKMSITLKNVPWEQALEIILEARGLEIVEKGNVIRIVTREQLARERESLAKLEESRVKAQEAKARAEAEIRQKAAEAALKEQEAHQRKLSMEQAIAEQQAKGPVVEETMRLAYADPEDVAKTLIGVLGITEGPAPAAAPVIPPAGPPFSALYGAQAPPQAAPSSEFTAAGLTIRAHKPTNSIFIRHYTTVVDRVRKLVRETLDVQLPQIKIEARLNEVSRRDLFDIGIQWGGGIAGRAGRNVLVGSGMDNPGTGITPVGVLGTATDRLGRNPNVTLGGFLPVNPTGLPLGGNVVSLPISGAPTFGIGFGIIGTRFNLNLALQALEEEGKTRSLAKPEIVTVENAKAAISLGSEIPYQTVSSAGTSVAFKEATLKLEVTPTVIREVDATKVKMKVIIEDNSQGIAVPSGSAGGFLPTINKRRAETEVVVREGATLVIGGITQRTESEIVQKVPLLGNIPVVGWMFKRRSFSVDPSRELVVFITPTIIRDAPPGTGPTAPPVSSR